MTNQLQAVTVYEINIVNGKPIAKPQTVYVDPANQVKPVNAQSRFSHAELTQESGRLNRSFNQGYFGS